MTRTRRALIALLLLLAIPLRTLAAAAMPCCPVDGPAHDMASMHEASMSMDDAAMSMDQGAVITDADRHDDVPPVALACFAVAMIAMPTFTLPLPAASPPGYVDALPATVDPFVTDAPERPPRAQIRAA